MPTAEDGITGSGGLIPKPYRTDGVRDVYRIPIHFARSTGGVRELCEWGGKDAQPGELDGCPVHGHQVSLCEANPDHLMARIPAFMHITTTADPAVPACRNCAKITPAHVENRLRETLHRAGFRSD